MNTIEVGDFIEVPTWKTFGQVVSVQPSQIRPGAQDVMLQEHPEQAIRNCRTYRLMPGEYTFA